MQREWLEGGKDEENCPSLLKETELEYSYYEDYKSRQPPTSGSGNQTIANFKKLSGAKPSNRVSPAERYYRTGAINQVSAAFIKFINNISAFYTKTDILLIPIPVSGSDDRLHKTACNINERCPVVDYIPDYLSSSSATSYSRSNSSRTLQEMQNYKKTLCLSALNKKYDLFLIIDDVITSGLHYRAIYEKIREHHKKQKIYGIFYAKTV